MEKESKEMRFVCEHCNESFHYEFMTPIAVRCSHCNSVFDARLQIIKSRKEVESDKATRH